MFKTQDYLSRGKMFLLFLIPVSVIAIFVVVIPYMISIETLFVTPVIFIAMISFLIFLRSKYFWSRKDRKFLDKPSTILCWIIFAIVVPFLVLVALLIILIYRKAIYVSAWVISITTLFVFGIRLEINGRLPKKQCITIYNHCSLVDDAFNSLIMMFRPWKVVYAKGLQRVPFANIFLRYIGIPLTREEMRSKKDVSDKVVSFLKEKKGNILVFPEGKRLSVEKCKELIMDFQDGAFRWSVECNVTIVPVVVSWTFLFKPRSGQWWFSPRTITINYLDSYLMQKGEGIDDFSERVRLIMLEKLRLELKEKKRWKLI